MRREDRDRLMETLSVLTTVLSFFLFCGGLQLLFIMTPDGREVECEVPADVAQGDEFEVFVGSILDEDGAAAEANAVVNGENSDRGDSCEPKLMDVTCPEECSEGDVIAIELPDGTEMEVTIPEGVEPGEDFEIEY